MPDEFGGAVRVAGNGGARFLNVKRLRKVCINFDSCCGAAGATTTLEVATASVEVAVSSGSRRFCMEMKAMTIEKIAPSTRMR